MKNAPARLSRTCLNFRQRDRTSVIGRTAWAACRACRSADTQRPGWCSPACLGAGLSAARSALTRAADLTRSRRRTCVTVGRTVLSSTHPAHVVVKVRLGKVIDHADQRARSWTQSGSTLLPQSGQDRGGCVTSPPSDLSLELKVSARDGQTPERAPIGGRLPCTPWPRSLAGQGGYRLDPLGALCRSS